MVAILFAKYRLSVLVQVWVYTVSLLILIFGFDSRFI